LGCKIFVSPLTGHTAETEAVDSSMCCRSGARTAVLQTSLRRTSSWNLNRGWRLVTGPRLY